MSLMACSLRWQGQDKTVLSCPCQDKTKLSALLRDKGKFISNGIHTTDTDKTVLSCPCRQCEHHWRCHKTVVSSAVVFTPLTQTRQDSFIASPTVFTPPTQTRQNCLCLDRVGGVNTTADKTRQFCLVSVGGVNKLLAANWTRRSANADGTVRAHCELK